MFCSQDYVFTMLHSSILFVLFIIVRIVFHMFFRNVLNKYDFGFNEQIMSSCMTFFFCELRTD